jgi:hypothetical protein
MTINFRMYQRWSAHAMASARLDGIRRRRGARDPRRDAARDASASIVPVIRMVGCTPPWRSPIASGSSWEWTRLRSGNAGAIEGAVRSRKEPANEYGLTLCQADQSRSDFAAIADDLEFIRADWR